MANQTMESEIKTAWQAGFRTCLLTFTELPEERVEMLVDCAWIEATRDYVPPEQMTLFKMPPLTEMDS